METIRLVESGFPDRPGLDAALSRAFLQRTSSGELGATIRVHTPADVVAFGRQDVIAPGYRDAVAAARAHDFEAVERIAGGRAAVFHAGTIAFSWTVPSPSPVDGIAERFASISQVVTKALRAVGVEAGVGEVPGEYCPGEYSVNARGRTKLMGVGQRLGRRAAHVGGVIVVTGSERIRRVLVPVYDALGLAWEPATVGAVADEVGDCTVRTVTDALITALGDLASIVPGSLDDDTLRLAEQLLDQHLSPAR